jgi:hypothetical protein
MARSTCSFTSFGVKGIAAAYLPVPANRKPGEEAKAGKIKRLKGNAFSLQP